MATQNLPKTTPIYDAQVIDYFVDSIYQVADPDITLKNLGLTRKHLRELLTDNDISAAVETRRENLIKTSWRLEPYKSRQEKFIWNELENVIENVLRNAFNAVLYGYSVSEVIYQQLPDGKIGIKSAYEVPLEYFEPKNNGDLVFRSIDNPMGTVVDKQFKFLFTVKGDTFANPYGEALLSQLYFIYLFRKAGWKFWSRNLERSASPFLRGIAPNETLPDGTPAVEYLSGILNQAVSNATIALPEGWNAEFLSAPQTGQSFNLFDDALLARIQRSVLGQTLTSQMSSSGGSFAAAQVHENILESKRLSDIRLVTKTVQTLVNALHTLNGFSGEPPVFIMQDDTGLELERAERDAKLVQAGIIKLTDSYLYRTYDFENGDFEIPQSADFTSQNDRLNLTQKPQPAKFSAETKPVKFTKDQQLIEDLADKALENIKSPISERLIFNAIKAAKDYDDLVDRLAVLYQDTDTVEFRTILERTTLAADVMGFVNASK